MDRLDAMRVFVAVTEAKGLAPAARKLSMSPPAVTRAIAALEARLGARLLHRTTRAVRLTEVGARFFEDCKRILEAVEEAESTATGSQREPRGQLSVTAPLMFGRLHVGPVLLDFLAQHPQLTARTLFVDQLVDLMEESIDAAVRIGALAESSLRAIPLGKMRRVLCASPGYLAERGVPKKPADLALHELIAFTGTTPRRMWRFQTHGKQEVVGLTPRLHVNTSDMAITAAVAGRGLTRVLAYQVAAELREKKLVIVLANHELTPAPVQIVHAEGRMVSARVRAFVDFAVEHLRRRVADAAP